MLVVNILIASYFIVLLNKNDLVLVLYEVIFYWNNINRSVLKRRTNGCEKDKNYNRKAIKEVKYTREHLIINTLREEGKGETMKKLFDKIKPGIKGLYIALASVAVLFMAFGTITSTSQTTENSQTAEAFTNEHQEIASSVTETDTVESATEIETIETEKDSLPEETLALNETEAETNPPINEKETEETAVADSTEPDLMEVHFIDVGQGDSTLIKCGDNAMLIDAGDDSKGTALQNYLKKQGITKLNYLILTHPDADHIGAAPVIITKFDIDTVFVSNFEKDNKTYEKLIQALDDKQLRYSTPEVGDSYTLGSAEFTILAPNGNYDEPNNASIALLLENGENSFLFSGDAEEEAEEDIVSNGMNISADVYQVGHHGSKTSSSQVFLDAINPSYAVISCGEDNSYGHPHAQTLNALRSMNVKVFRTDEQGSIVAEANGTEITWNCAPSETWQSGEPKGSSTDTADNNSEKTTSAGATAKSTEQVTIQENTNTQTAGSSTPATTATESVEPQNTEQPVEQTDNNSIEVHITETGKKYHSAGCQYLKKSDIVVTLEQAKNKGLGPCSKCNPPQ